MPTISIWKAPQSLEKQRAFLAHGIRVQDVDDKTGYGHPDYGFVFFAASKSDAAIFANCYKAGIIEFSLEADNFAAIDKKIRPLPGFVNSEVLIPYSALDVFNRCVVERKLHV